MKDSEFGALANLPPDPEPLPWPKVGKDQTTEVWCPHCRYRYLTRNPGHVISCRRCGRRIPYKD